MFAFLMVFMLPNTNDLKVWERFQTALLFTDMAALYSIWKAVEVQGGLWTSEGAGNIGIILVVTVVRLLFVMSVDMGKGPIAKKRNGKSLLGMRIGRRRWEGFRRTSLGTVNSTSGYTTPGSPLQQPIRNVDQPTSFQSASFTDGQLIIPRTTRNFRRNTQKLLSISYSDSYRKSSSIRSLCGMFYSEESRCGIAQTRGNCQICKVPSHTTISVHEKLSTFPQP
jgi:hypothetical protein